MYTLHAAALQTVACVAQRLLKAALKIHELAAPHCSRPQLTFHISTLVHSGPHLDTEPCQLLKGALRHVAAGACGNCLSGSQADAQQRGPSPLQGRDVLVVGVHPCPQTPPAFPSTGSDALLGNDSTKAHPS